MEPTPKRLLDQVRDAIRLKHYSIRTEEAYVNWIKRYIYFHTIAEEALDCVVREMTDPAGGFCSTQDADSGGEEGKFFVWTPDEIHEARGEEADPFLEACGGPDQIITVGELGAGTVVVRRLRHQD